MDKLYQITANEVVSGICRSIYDTFGEELNIYKEKEQFIDLPGVSVYCIDSTKTMGRCDRFTNTFNVIINYFNDDTGIINNKRQNMYSTVEKLMDAIRYINLPGYKKVDDELVETTLKCRCGEFTFEEKEEGFMQISATYTVRTKLYKDQIKMEQLNLDVTSKTGG